MKIPMTATKSAIFDASGIAVVTLGPNRPFTSWKIEKITTSTDNSTETQLRIYRGIVTASNFISGTNSANENADDSANINLITSEFLTFVWSNGSGGKIATIVIYGEEKIKRNVGEE